MKTWRHESQRWKGWDPRSKVPDHIRIGFTDLCLIFYLFTDMRLWEVKWDRCQPSPPLSSALFPFLSALSYRKAPAAVIFSCRIISALTTQEVREPGYSFHLQYQLLDNSRVALWPLTEMDLGSVSPAVDGLLLAKAPLSMSLPFNLPTIMALQLLEFA